MLVPYIEISKDSSSNIRYTQLLCNANSNNYTVYQLLGDLYAMYSIGLFYNEDGTVNGLKNPIDPKHQTMQKMCTDILGLEYTEIKPKIKERKFSLLILKDLFKNKLIPDLNDSAEKMLLKCVDESNVFLYDEK